MSSTPPPAPAAYMLLFRNTGPEVYQHLSPAQRQDIVTRWNAWFEALVAEGKAVEGQPLEMDTRIVAGPGGARIIDGPYPEAKEAIAGYVKLLVNDREEATAIAQRHPALAYGMMIEVRELTPGCHLGVTTKPVTPQAGAKH
ncbi:MAG TPA: YciI family protein [Lacunisphaera sp.]